MKVRTDLHTHTNKSGHALSTALENIEWAKRNGMELITITEHGPAYEPDDKTSKDYFESLSYWISRSRNIDGVTVLSGVEANILNASGDLDMEKLDPRVFQGLDIVIASCHSNIYSPRDDESFKGMYAAVISNPHVDILGHMCRNMSKKHIDEIIDLAKQKEKLIEFNELSLAHPSSELRDSLKLLILKCMDHKANVVVNTDAHFAPLVGKANYITEFLSKIKYPEDLIINRDQETLLKFLNERAGNKKISLDECVYGE